MALHHARFTTILAGVLLLISFFDWVNASSNIDTGTPNKAAAFYPRGRDRPHDYKIINEEVRYAGWRKVIQRSVSAPIHPHHTHLDDTTLITTETHDNDGTTTASTNTDNKNKDSSSQPQRKIIHFDIIDQTHTTGGAVIIFAWNTTSKTATIIREYMPGPHRILGGLAAGIVEDGKHSSMEGVGDTCSLVAARYELEEECHLAGGTWYRLTEEGVSVPMDKYVVTEITPYLVIDPVHVPDPRPLDDEEDIEIVTGVTAEEIVQMIREGDMNLVGGWGSLLALEKLRELGEIS